VPVEEDLSRGPMGRVLLDAAGRPLGRYDEGLRSGVPIADLFEREPGVSAEEAAGVILAELRGWKIAGDEALGRALIAAGGTKLRHGHLYSYDFRRRTPPQMWEAPAGIRLTDIDRPAADLVDARVAAYPPAHPDFGDAPDDHEAELDSLIYGGLYGPLLAGSGLAATEDGAVVGAIILGTIEGGEPPLYGPWVIDVFRRPGQRGVGRALLARALALAEVETLGLIVTEGNDAARRLYEALGFDHLSSAIVVQI
jgi:ribosomal protein S18 acetylase RimI-like enzyme